MRRTYNETYTRAVEFFVDENTSIRSYRRVDEYEKLKMSTRKNWICSRDNESTMFFLSMCDKNHNARGSTHFDLAECSHVHVYVRNECTRHVCSWRARVNMNIPHKRAYCMMRQPHVTRCETRSNFYSFVVSVVYTPYIQIPYTYTYV